MIGVWGDVSGFVLSADSYRIYDYHLRSHSPCIDSADGDLAPANDKDGKVPARRPAPSTPAKARPRTPTAARSRPTSASTLSTWNKDALGANDGTSWTDAYTDVQAALPDAVWGDDLWIADGHLLTRCRRPR